MGTTYTISLEDSDLGQILDGFCSRSLSWRDTTEYLEFGYSPRDDFIIEECRDAEEARAIAGHYDQIIAGIETQMKAQGAAS